MSEEEQYLQRNFLLWLMEEDRIAQDGLNALALLDKQAKCAHDDWEIAGHDIRGTARCAKCGKVMPFTVLVMNWKSRIERELGVNS